MDKTTTTSIALQTSSPKDTKRKRAPKDKALKLYTPKASNPVTDLIAKASSLASSSASSSSASSSNPNSKTLLESIIIGRRRRIEIENERKQDTTTARTKESLIEWAQNSEHLKLNFSAIITFLNDESHPINVSPFTILQNMLDMQSFNGSRERSHFYLKRKRAWKELHSVAMPYLEQQKLKASTMDRETEIVCNDLREQAKKSKRSSSSSSGSGKKGGKAAAGRGKRSSTSNTSSSPPSPSASPHPSSTATSGESAPNASSQPRLLPPDVLERLGLERVKVWRIITNQRQQGKTAKAFHQNLTNRQSNAKKVAQLCQRDQRKLSLRLVSRADRELTLRCRRLAKDQASFWRKFEREEKEGRKRAERDLIEERRKEEELREERRQARKLQFLVNQTELYSHFVAGTKKNTDIADGHTTKLTASCDLADVSEADIKEHAEHLASEAYKNHKKKMEVFEGDGVGDGSVGSVDDGDNVATATKTTTKTPTNNMVTQPIMLQATLKPYQLKGLSWLSSLYEQGINGILADEMGLGKTIQAISLMAHIVERHGIYGPFLVVAPASTLHNWQQEIQRFIPSLRALPYWGTVAERKSLRSFWRWTGDADGGAGVSTLPLGAPQSANLRHKYTKDSPFHILITSYQLIVTDAAYLSKEKWQYMILDEAQALKSSQSQRWKTLLSFQCRNRLLLTGTPIQNGMQELWALLHFIMPTLFDSHDEFADWFSKDIESHSTTSTSTTSTVSKLNSFQLNRLHMILKPFMLRRTKMEVIHELAPKTEIDILCHLSPRQKTLTRRLRKGLPMMVNGSSNGDTTSTLMNLMMQLRKTCNHPLLFGSSTFKSPFVMSEQKPYWYGRGNVPGTSTSMARYWKAPPVQQPEWLPCLLKLMMQKDSPPSLSPFVVSADAAAANNVGLIAPYCNNDLSFVGSMMTTSTEEERERTTETTEMFSSLIDSVDLQTALPLKKLIGWKPACQRVDAMGDGDLLELPDPMQSLLLDSGKMVELDRLLLELRKGDHRVLLYNQMTKMIDIMEEYLQWRRFSYLRLDGSNKISERRDLVHEWQTGDAFIFLLSTRAGGLGINLTSADTVIFYDSDWNPTVDQQAMDRSHRLGQTKPVTVYRLITKNSVEERMRERALQKGEIHNVVIAGGKFEHDDVGGGSYAGGYAGDDGDGANNISTTTTTAATTTTTSNTPDRDELQSLLMDDDDI